MTAAQEQSLGDICGRYHVDFDPAHYAPQFDLPPGYVAGWVGGPVTGRNKPTIFVGCSPEGAISS